MTISSVLILHMVILTIKKKLKYLAPKFSVAMKITKPMIVTGIGYLSPYKHDCGLNGRNNISSHEEPEPISNLVRSERMA